MPKKHQWIDKVKNKPNKDDDKAIKKLIKSLPKNEEEDEKLVEQYQKMDWKKKGGKPGEKDEKDGKGEKAMGAELTLTAPRNVEAYHKAQAIELDSFDHEKVSLDSMIIVIGKRRYGKTVWAEWLLSHMHQFFPRGGYVFTNTKHNYFWQKHFPENRVYAGVFPELIEQILNDQKALYQAIMLGAKVDISPFIIIVLDDVITSKEIRYNPKIQELAWAGRHYFICCIICSQDIKGLPPGFRGNSDLIACTYQTQNRTMETLQEDFADFFDNRYMFQQILMKFTPDHGMLIIDQTTAKFSMDEIFYTDRAPDPSKETVFNTDSFGKIKVKGPVFKIGADDFWNQSQNNWMTQLFKAQNIPSSKREDWDKRIEEQLKDPNVQEYLETSFDPKNKKDPFDEEHEGKQNFDEAQPLADAKVSELSEHLGIDLAVEDEPAVGGGGSSQKFANSLDATKNKILMLRNRFN